MITVIEGAHPPLDGTFILGGNTQLFGVKLVQRRLNSLFEGRAASKEIIALQPVIVLIPGPKCRLVSDQHWTDVPVEFSPIFPLLLVAGENTAGRRRVLTLRIGRAGQSLVTAGFGFIPLVRDAHQERKIIDRLPQHLRPTICGAAHSSASLAEVALALIAIVARQPHRKRAVDR